MFYTLSSEFIVLDIEEAFIEDEDYMELKVVSRIKQPYPCMHLWVPLPTYKSTRVLLELLNYYPFCSVEKKSLEKGIGTIQMVQLVLCYLFKQRTYLTAVDLSDETFISIAGNASRPLIVSRRLLTGRPSWYEEHLGAIPKGTSTRDLLVYLRTPVFQERMRVLLQKYPESSSPLWWVPENIYKLTMDLRSPFVQPSKLLGTTWEITADTIRAYKVQYQREEHTGGGKGHLQSRIHRMFRSALPSRVLSYL
jgi:hypothetical protein